MPRTERQKARRREWWRKRYATDPAFREAHKAKSQRAKQSAKVRNPDFNADRAARKRRRRATDPAFRAHEAAKSRAHRAKVRAQAKAADARAADLLAASGQSANMVVIAPVESEWQAADREWAKATAEAMFKRIRASLETAPP